MKRPDGKTGMAKALLAALAMLLAGLTWAQGELSPQEFVDHAAANGMAEVELGKVAQEKSSNAAVVQFAAQMVKDHEAANQKLKALASQKGIKPSTDMADAMNKAKATMLEMRDESFDQAYMENQVKAHQQTIALFERAAAGLADPEMKALAQQTLPTLQQHLKMAQQVLSTLQKR